MRAGPVCFLVVDFISIPSFLLAVYMTYVTYKPLLCVGECIDVCLFDSGQDRGHVVDTGYQSFVYRLAIGF